VVVGAPDALPFGHTATAVVAPHRVVAEQRRAVEQTVKVRRYADDRAGPAAVADDRAQPLSGRQQHAPDFE